MTLPDQHQLTLQAKPIRSNKVELKPIPLRKEKRLSHSHLIRQKLNLLLNKGQSNSIDYVTPHYYKGCCFILQLTLALLPLLLELTRKITNIICMYNYLVSKLVIHTTNRITLYYSSKVTGSEGMRSGSRVDC